MSSREQSFLQQAYNPLLQGGFIFCTSSVIMLISMFLNWAGIMEVGHKFAWMTAAAFLLFYAVGNSIFSLSAKDFNKYYSKSMLSFILLGACSAGMAYLITGMWITEVGSYKWIYAVVGVGYIVFLSMMGMMKKIVEFAQKEVWTHPKKRKK